MARRTMPPTRAATGRRGRRDGALCRRRSGWPRAHTSQARREEATA
eukprot:CAMPEP_0119077744 /NCGR_PEP_ID=MMETSP1178-20130426/96003_1 /TAXON_ID=33656 /ORGANISM="unid sp, Strain CCMP2000" /LENGTH=45 /DNA_ID= /DNA_START= /DNA_END= /DNA_ORIENTATION=